MSYIEKTLNRNHKNRQFGNGCVLIILTSIALIPFRFSSFDKIAELVG